MVPWIRGAKSFCFNSFKQPGPQRPCLAGRLPPDVARILTCRFPRPCFPRRNRYWYHSPTLATVRLYVKFSTQLSFVVFPIDSCQNLPILLWTFEDYKGNFTQFYATKSERAKNQRREYESQLQYRQHLQAFIDRWRYNANRAAQAQSKIKILEKLPELEPPEDDDVVHFKFAPTDKLTPPLLQLEDCSFGYSTDKPILKHVNIDGMSLR
jgi:hypothetical protein